MNKNIITAKFKRTFVEGLQHTWLFDEAPHEVKLLIGQVIGRDVVVVACSYFSPVHWFAVTEKGLTIEQNGFRQTIYSSNITKIDCDLAKLAADKNKPFDVIDIYTPNGILPLEVEKKTWGAWVEVLGLL